MKRRDRRRRLRCNPLDLRRVPPLEGMVVQGMVMMMTMMLVMMMGGDDDDDSDDDDDHDYDDVMM